MSKLAEQIESARRAYVGSLGTADEFKMRTLLEKQIKLASQTSTKSDGRMQAIPTTYAGVRFRSRLEARWAAFFDLVGWEWEYEPLDLNGYIPDFVLAFAKPLLVEVKPLWYPGASAHMDEQGKVRIFRNYDAIDPFLGITSEAADEQEVGRREEALSKIFRSGWPHESLIVGARLVQADHFQSSSFGTLCRTPLSGESVADWHRFGIDSAFWFRCLQCSRPSLAAMTGSYACRVCMTDRPLPAGQSHQTDPWDAVAAFREAGNRVQWNPTT